MFWSTLKGSISKVKKPLSDETLFKILTSLKMAIIPTMTIGILASMLWIILSINLIFFDANGFSRVRGIEDAYYEHLSQIFFSHIWWIVLSYLFIFVLGFYISHLIIRPFKQIGDYCERVSKGDKAEYNQELFSDLRLLTSFCDYFFNQMENALKNKVFASVGILRKYQKIHGPVFEKTFFIQIFSIILIASVLGGLGIYYFMLEIYMDIIRLSLQSLKSEPVGLYFFSEQKEIFFQIVNMAMVIHMIMNAFLCLHLHSLISGPSFAIFSTMRGFLKGDFDLRIHIIGARYLRDYTLKINKYLEYLKKNIKISNE